MTELPQTAALNAEQERSRLIDHFKRAYQIIVGLAITLACTKLGIGTVPDVVFWLFCTFFVTVVPIFHGGDRSLDIKYLTTQVRGFWHRASYIWDVYMLLVTAILFVKIAQTIPGPPIFGSGLPTTTPQLFYEWMAGMLAFDVIVLFVDWLKGGSSRQKLSAYSSWVFLNLTLALVCYWAAFPPSFLPMLSDETVAMGVFCFALLRTFLDYSLGGDFLFP